MKHQCRFNLATCAIRDICEKRGACYDSTGSTVTPPSPIPPDLLNELGIIGVLRMALAIRVIQLAVWIGRGLWNKDESNAIINFADAVKKRWGM